MISLIFDKDAHVVYTLEMHTYALQLKSMPPLIGI